MAISWLTAFKAIPWGDVIAAAPAVAQGAKKLWSTVGRGGDAGAAAGALPADAEGRLRVLEAQVAELQRERAAATELIQSLAEQNSRLVDAIEILRVRTRALLAISLALAAFAAGLALWLLLR